MLLDEELEKINIEDANNVMVLQNIIANLNKYQINDYNKVLNLLYKIEKKYPKYFIVTTLIAEILYNSNNEEYIKYSINYYNKTIELISELKDITFREQLWKCNCYVKIANFYYDRKEYPNAAYNYENIIDLLENIQNNDDELFLFTASNYFCLANTYYNDFLRSDNINNFQLMIEYYNKAIENYNLVNNINYNIIKNIGICHYQIANIDLKYNLHNLTISNFNLNSEMFKISIENFNLAIKNFTYILNNNMDSKLSKDFLFELNFKMAESHFYLSYIAYICDFHEYSESLYKIAILYYKKALELTGDNLENIITTLNQLGLVYLFFGMYEEAIEVYQKSKDIIGDISNIDSNPKIYTSVYINLSNSYLRNKEYDKAIAILEYIYNTKYCDEVVVMSLSAAYSVNKQYDRSIEILSKAIEEKEYTHYDIFHNLGRCYIEKSILDNYNYYNEAVKYLSKSLKKQSKSYLAYAYLKLQKELEAYNVLDELVENNLSYDVFIILYRMYKDNLLSYDKSKHYFECIFKKNIKFYSNSKDAIFLKDNILYQYSAWYRNPNETPKKRKKSEKNIKKLIEELICYKNITFKDPHTFNDPIDPPTKILKKDNILNNITHNFRIACFTTDPYNILMWAHYANKHKGICIAYDIKEILNDFDIAFKKVIYNTKITLDEDKEIDNLFNMQNMLKIYSTDSMYPLDLFFTKHELWKYENEYKLIKYVGDNCKSTVLKKASIIHIYLGKDIDEEDEKFIIKISKNNNIPVSKISCKKSNLYELESYIITK
ncbi:DUF2971 domain-containing protein [Brachyspira pilosicoli]|uniref:DUF2971 domain-containing protein n=1 Tax=Brachyspira pilosicoli TaxID=52584 RepID=UPI003004E36C